MRLAGSASPEAISAARTRSRDSATALSGSPTTVKATVPGAICTCTSTARASIPSKATVATRVTMRGSSGLHSARVGASVTILNPGRSRPAAPATPRRSNRPEVAS